jgi:hypothetical protein
MQAQPGSFIEPGDPEPRRGPSQATKRMAALSPRFKARMAGVFQFLEGLTSAGGQVVILVGCAMQALTSLLYLAPLLVLQGGSALSAFTPQQLQDLSLVFLTLNARAYDIYLVFFGLWCVLIGFLIFRSTFLPRILGVLLMIDGVGWMLYLFPPLAQQLFPLIAVAAGLAEFPLLLWLLVVGCNAERWKEQEAAAGVSLRT